MFEFHLCFDRKRQCTIVPQDYWANKDEQVDPELKFVPDFTVEGFYQLVGYTGEKFAADWLKLTEFVEVDIAWKMIDRFIYGKIKIQAENAPTCIISKKSLNRENLYARLTPTYTCGRVDEWLQNDVIVEFGCWEMRHEYLGQANHMINKITEDGFDFYESLNKINSIKPINHVFNGKDLKHCYSLKILQRYWDFNRGDWCRSIRVHNYNIANACGVTRNATMVSSHSSMTKTRETKQQKTQTNKLSKTRNTEKTSANNNKNNKKRMRGHDDGEWEGVGTVDESFIGDGNGNESLDEIPDDENDFRYVLV